LACKELIHNRTALQLHRTALPTKVSTLSSHAPIPKSTVAGTHGNEPEINGKTLIDCAPRIVVLVILERIFELLKMKTSERDANCIALIENLSDDTSKQARMSLRNKPEYQFGMNGKMTVLQK
jgi:hypothetical protein